MVFAAMLQPALADFPNRSHADLPPLATPLEVWEGYDPDTLPLEVEPLKSWTEDEAHFEKLRFTSQISDGVKVRVFALRGAPASGERSLPGILHIHGGGQTASLDWVRFWCKRGYVAVTYDFCGPWANRSEVTDWGTLKHCNMAEAHGGYQVDPTPRSSSWYHWTVAARRALSLLAEHPQVARDRLGIFGISVGGTLCWMVAGSDHRVKAAVPIYGCGYNLDGRRQRFGFPELTPAQALFQRAMSSEAHAPYIRCPVLFLDATNDFHGWMDAAYATLGAVSGTHRQAFTPRYNHHIASPQGADLPAWMDLHLKGKGALPKSPRLSISLGDDGVCLAQVDADSEQVKSVEIFYALGDKPPPSRFWRRSNAKANTAPLPVVDTWDDLRAFASVEYASGWSLSTNLAHVVPAQLGPARPSLAVGQGVDATMAVDSWYYATAATDPLSPKQFVIFNEDRAHPSARVNPDLFGESITVNLASHLVGDPQLRRDAARTLLLECSGSTDEAGLTISVTEHDWTPRAQTYSMHFRREQIPPKWSSLDIPRELLKTTEGKPLDSWRYVDKLQLQCKSPRSAHFQVGAFHFSED
jgi:dienelactone hydrolase